MNGKDSLNRIKYTVLSHADSLNRRRPHTLSRLWESSRVRILSPSAFYLIYSISYSHSPHTLSRPKCLRARSCFINSQMYHVIMYSKCPLHCIALWIEINYWLKLVCHASWRIDCRLQRSESQGLSSSRLQTQNEWNVKVVLARSIEVNPKEHITIFSFTYTGAIMLGNYPKIKLAYRYDNDTVRVIRNDLWIIDSIQKGWIH